MGADVVEVAPAYDSGALSKPHTKRKNPDIFVPAEVTGIAAADIVHDCLSLFLAAAPPEAGTPWTRPVRTKSKDEL